MVKEQVLDETEEAIKLVNDLESQKNNKSSHSNPEYKISAPFSHLFLIIFLYNYHYKFPLIFPKFANLSKFPLNFPHYLL